MQTLDLLLSSPAVVPMIVPLLYFLLPLTLFIGVIFLLLFSFSHCCKAQDRERCITKSSQNVNLQNHRHPTAPVNASEARFIKGALRGGGKSTLDQA
jgi:hypothetical protein